MFSSVRSRGAPAPAPAPAARRPGQYDRTQLVETRLAEADASRTRGRGYADEGAQRMRGFNPQQALNTYAQGAWGSISEALGRQLRDYEGESVGAGRFDSGFYDEGRGELVQGAVREFTNQLSSQAMNAAGMEQQNNAQLTAYGTGEYDRGYESLVDYQNFVEGKHMANKDRKAYQRGAALGGATSIGAALAGR
jgi:hypothetical protein